MEKAKAKPRPKGKGKGQAFEVSKSTLALIAATGIYVANYLSVEWLEYPFLYCWFATPAAALYMATGTLILSVSVLYAIGCLLKGYVWGAAVACVIFMVVVNLPRMADYYLRLGASCG